MLSKLTQYNLWANQTITSYVLKAGEAIADIEQAGSFPSVRKTLLHIWDAQFIWFNRLHGTSLSEFPSKSFKGNLQEACDGLLKSSQQIIDYVLPVLKGATLDQIESALGKCIGIVKASFKVS